MQKILQLFTSLTSTYEVIAVIPRAHAQEYRMQYVDLGTTKTYFINGFHKVLNLDLTHGYFLKRLQFNSRLKWQHTIPKRLAQVPVALNFAFP